MKSINQLICHFQEKKFLDKFEASQELLKLGQKAYPPLLEALESKVKAISDFAIGSLIWAQDPALVPILIERISLERGDAILLHPLSMVLLGYGEQVIPCIIDKIDQGKEYLKLLIALEEIIGHSVPVANTNDLERALEFERFLKDLHGFMVTPSRSDAQLQTNLLKGWWKKNSKQIPSSLDKSYIDRLLCLSPFQIRERKKSWKGWWKKNKSAVERYLSEAYLDVLEPFPLSVEEIDEADENEEDWLSAVEEGTPSYALTSDGRIETKWALKQQWMALWQRYRSFQEEISVNEETALSQAFWHLKMDNFLGTLEILNNLALRKALNPKKGPLSKMYTSFLTEVAGEVEELLSNFATLGFHESWGKLILSLCMELLGKRKEALAHLEEEVILESPPSEWWAAVYYYKEQALARLYLRRNRYPMALQHILLALEVSRNILLLRRSLTPGQLPPPLVGILFKGSLKSVLPSAGREIPFLYSLEEKILSGWKK